MYRRAQKTLFGRVVLTAGVVMGVLALSVAGAHAAIILLQNWNVTQLDASDDAVQVKTGLDCDPTDPKKICVEWLPGSSHLSVTANGIDTFFYDISAIEGESVPHITSVTGNFSSWQFNFDGKVADGFVGKFDSQRSQGPGETSLSLVFTLNGPTEGLKDFAVHVRYTNGCSGWVSNREVNPGSQQSDVRCAGVKVPEPPTGTLFGFSIVGVALAAAGRNLRKRSPLAAA
jgi:hypothetical protein